MNRKKNRSSIIWLLVLILFSIFNEFLKIIVIPDIENIIQDEIDYITISTVFIGFAFTSLGILLGMSSEKLIQRVNNTSIIMNMVFKIVQCILFFVASIFVSLYFILGLNKYLCGLDTTINVNNVFYVFGVSSLVIGILHYTISIYKLYELIKLIYTFNKEQSVIDSNNRALEQISKERKKLEEASFDNNA